MIFKLQFLAISGTTQSEYEQTGEVEDQRTKLCINFEGRKQAITFKSNHDLERQPLEQNEFRQLGLFHIGGFQNSCR